MNYANIKRNDVKSNNLSNFFLDAFQIIVVVGAEFLEHGFFILPNHDDVLCGEFVGSVGEIFQIGLPIAFEAFNFQCVKWLGVLFCKNLVDLVDKLDERFLLVEVGKDGGLLFCEVRVHCCVKFRLKINKFTLYINFSFIDDCERRNLRY